MDANGIDWSKKNGFIKGYQIQEGFLVAHETIHTMKYPKRKRPNSQAEFLESM